MPPKNCDSFSQTHKLYYNRLFSAINPALQLCYPGLLWNFSNERLWSTQPSFAFTFGIDHPDHSICRWFPGAFFVLFSSIFNFSYYPILGALIVFITTSLSMKTALIVDFQQSHVIWSSRYQPATIWTSRSMLSCSNKRTPMVTIFAYPPYLPIRVWHNIGWL